MRFFYNQFWGNGRIRVDGVVIRRFIVILSLSTSRWYRFVVGSGERHEVEIEKVRKRFFGGLNEQYVRVFIDSELRSSY